MKLTGTNCSIGLIGRMQRQISEKLSSFLGIITEAVIVDVFNIARLFGKIIWDVFFFHVAG